MTIGPTPPLNPYAPPTADVDAAAVPRPDSGGYIVASRRSRLGAALLDSLLVALAFIPFVVFLIAGGESQRPKIDTALGSLWWVVGSDPLQVVGMGCWAGVMLLQAYLVTTTGQTVGKRLVGIRIVRLDDQPAGFLRGVLLRTWLFMALNNIPTVGGFIILVDTLFILGLESRCLHDHLASTKVVEAPRTT